MDLGISGKIALVNGGSAGLGHGAALALAREKTTLFVTARGEERLEKACAEMIKETGANITPIAADHSSDEGRDKILSICPTKESGIHQRHVRSGQGRYMVAENRLRRLCQSQ